MARPPISVRNNNPGNLREVGISWEGKTGSSGGFTSFSSPEMGVRAMTKQLYKYGDRGNNTIREVISTWAPASDNNNTPAYINKVSNDLGLNPDAPLNLRNNPQTTSSLIQSMINMEGGAEASSYFNSSINRGVALANGTVDPIDVATVAPELGSLDALEAFGGRGPDVAGANAQPGGEPGSSSRGGGGSQVYKENVLNKYNSYNYNWKISMIHPLNAGTAAASNGVVLAESGVEAELNISSVEHLCTTGYRNKHRDIFGNTFKVELIEPMGLTFYNRLVLAADRLGITNHLDATYILEVKWIGVTDSGSIDMNASGPFSFTTKLKDSMVTHREGASTYTLEFFEVSEEGYTNSIITMDQPITITGVETFGEFLKEYEKEIKIQEDKNVELGPKLFPTKYTFQTFDGAEEWEGWKFASIDEDLNDQRVSVTFEDKLTFTINQGANILSAIHMALYCTEEYQKIPLYEGGSAKDKPDDQEAKAPSLAQIAAWAKIETDIKYGPFDPLMGKYSLDITYKIGKFAATHLVHDPKSYLEIADGGLTKTRLNAIMANGLLQKRYDYIYTGLNTEVIDFDITLQKLHHLVQPLRAGTIQFSEQQKAGSGDAELNIINELEATFNDLQKDLTDLKGERADIQASLADSGLNPADQAFFRSAEVERLNVIEQEIKTLEGRTKSAKEELRDAHFERSVANAAAGNRRLQQGASQKYITQSQVYSAGQGARADEPRYKFVETKIRSEATEGPDKNRETASGAVLLGAVEINLNALADLQTIQLTIRGDPYWLGEPAGSEAPYTKGGVHFFLNIEFPNYPDDNTGLMPTQAEYDFSIMGLYRVTAVTSIYRDGQFIQILNAFRDTMTNVGMNLEQLKSGIVQGGRGTRTQAGRPLTFTGGDGASTGSLSPTDRGPDLGSFATGTGAGNVTQAQSGIRNQAINGRLENILQTAAVNTGVDVRVTSGGQPAKGSGGGPRTGSTRHDNGMAADVQLISGGRTLSLNNPADVPIIQNFISESKKAGATGFGAGNGYMGDNTYHIDIAGRPGYWGGQLDGGTYRSRNAPLWLRRIVTGT